MSGYIPEGALITGTISITRFIAPDGADLVAVTTDDTRGERIGVVEALGLLQLAIYDVSNAPADDGGNE